MQRYLVEPNPESKGKMMDKQNKDLLMFELLKDLARKINGLEGMKEILNQALDRTIEIAGLESGSIILWDEETKKVTDEVISGDLEKNQILRTLEKNVLQNLRASFAVESVFLTLQKETLLSFFSYPVKMDEKLVGVINGLSAGTRDFPQEVGFLEALSYQLGLAVVKKKYKICLAELSEKRISTIRETAAGLNHVVNNLLMTIVGNADLLLLTKDNLDSETMKRLKAIEETAMEIRELIQGLTKIAEPVIVDYEGGIKMLDIRKSKKEEPAEDSEE